MTHAAVLKTDDPSLQALFSADWASGKYRRDKCSKADFYAGWLSAYERFKSVAPVEKISIVETNPVKTSTPPARAKKNAKNAGILDQYSTTCRGVWVKACTSNGVSSMNNGHLDLCQEDNPRLREIRGYRYENGHAMRNLCDTQVTGKKGRTEWVNAADEHNKLVTYYGSPESRARLLATDIRQMRQECDMTFWLTDKRFNPATTVKPK